MLPQTSPGDAAVEPRTGTLRIQPDRLVTVSDGLFTLTDQPLDDAAVEPRIGIFRIQPDRLVKVGDGLFMLPQISLGDAAVEPRFGIFRLWPDFILPGHVFALSPGIIPLMAPVSLSPIAPPRRSQGRANNTARHVAKGRHAHHRCRVEGWGHGARLFPYHIAYVDLLTHVIMSGSVTSC